MSLTARTGALDNTRIAIGGLNANSDEGDVEMHFRVFDLAAERCVWSIPPIDMVPWKLRMERLVVRSIDNEGKALTAEATEGLKLEGLITRLLDDRRAARLSIHLARDESYAGHVQRLRAE